MEKKDWFAGNVDALDLYERLVFIAHAWDDLIDRDKPVSDEKINKLVLNLLLYLPGNRFYRQYEIELRTLIIVGVVGYLTANLVERDSSSSDHAVELAHYLRYAVANVGIFMIYAMHGMDDAPAVLAEAMPVMVPERVAQYVEEVRNALA